MVKPERPAAVCNRCGAFGSSIHDLHKICGRVLTPSGSVICDGVFRSALLDRYWSRCTVCGGSGIDAATARRCVACLGYGEICIRFRGGDDPVTGP